MMMMMMTMMMMMMMIRKYSFAWQNSANCAWHLVKLCSLPQQPGFYIEKLSSEGVRIEVPKGWRLGMGCPLPN